MNLVNFGSYSPPAPTSYELEFIDMDSADTGRGEDGYLISERVRADAAKLYLEFTNITVEDTKTIRSATSPNEVSVKYFDGTMEHAIMKRSNRKLKLKHLDADGTAYFNMSFNMTEF